MGFGFFLEQELFFFFWQLIEELKADVLMQLGGHLYQ